MMASSDAPNKIIIIDYLVFCYNCFLNCASAWTSDILEFQNSDTACRPSYSKHEMKKAQDNLELFKYQYHALC